MPSPSPRQRGFVLAAALLFALVVVSVASAHAEISPGVAKAKSGQLFTLAVPTEEENASTVSVQLTCPAGFAIDSFVAAPGWTRKVQQTGSGEAAVVQTVTWTGGKVPTGEDAVFQFLASPQSAKTYRFAVTQTYSNGKEVEWNGAESSDTPAPTVEALDSFSGGGSSTLEIVALVVAVLALILAVVALLGRGGDRQLA